MICRIVPVVDTLVPVSNRKSERVLVVTKDARVVVVRKSPNYKGSLVASGLIFFGQCVIIVGIVAQ